MSRRAKRKLGDGGGTGQRFRDIKHPSGGCLPPTEFKSWEQCRDYYSLEAMFLGQYYSCHKTKANKQRYSRASKLAIAANDHCKNPLPMEKL